MMFRTEIFIRIFQGGLLKDFAILRQNRTIFFSSPPCESSWILGSTPRGSPEMFSVCSQAQGRIIREGTCNSEPRSQAANTMGQRKSRIKPWCGQPGVKSEFLWLDAELFSLVFLHRHQPEGSLINLKAWMVLPFFFPFFKQIAASLAFF